MTPSEFKAWFEGFTEAMEAAPTEAQWSKIKARVAQIDGRPITQQVFVDRYYPRPYRDWTPYFNNPYVSLTTTSGGAGWNGAGTYTAAQFDSYPATAQLGRDDAMN